MWWGPDSLLRHPPIYLLLFNICLKCSSKHMCGTHCCQPEQHLRWRIGAEPFELEPGENGREDDSCLDTSMLWHHIVTCALLMQITGMRVLLWAHIAVRSLCCSLSSCCSGLMKIIKSSHSMKLQCIGPFPQTWFKPIQTYWEVEAMALVQSFPAKPGFEVSYLWKKIYQ